MYSWWWVELSPETCRVKPLRRINAIVASWIYFTTNELLISLRHCVLERPTPLPSLKSKHYFLYTSVTLSCKTISSFVSLSSFSDFKPWRRTYFNTSRQRRRQVLGLEFRGVTLAARLIVLDGVETVRELHTLLDVLIEFLMKWRSPRIQFLLHGNE